MSKIMDRITDRGPDVACIDGDEDTIVVLGGGKSAMDAACLMARRGKKVVWSSRGPLKWYAPAVAPGSIGAG
jgi:NADPH-dependent glutamate synthase beta subunit-like oxidoreductase